MSRFVEKYLLLHGGLMHANVTNETFLNINQLTLNSNTRFHTDWLTATSQAATTFYGLSLSIASFMVWN